jgi:hypothetical protein
MDFSWHASKGTRLIAARIQGEDFVMAKCITADQRISDGRRVDQSVYIEYDSFFNHTSLVHVFHLLPKKGGVLYNARQ